MHAAGLIYAKSSIERGYLVAVTGTGGLGDKVGGQCTVRCEVAAVVGPD